MPACSEKNGNLCPFFSFFQNITIDSHWYYWLLLPSFILFCSFQPLNLCHTFCFNSFTPTPPIPLKQGPICFVNKSNPQIKPTLSKIERKSLLRAGQCARLFERSVGVFFLIQPREASFAAPCSQKIGLKWQVYDG